MSNSEEKCEIDLTAEVRARIGNIVNKVRVRNMSEIDEQGHSRKDCYNITNDERVLSIYPESNVTFYIEFKNGGILSVKEKDGSSIDIRYADKPERAKYTFLPLELDDCYTTLSNLPKWMQETINGWSDDETEKNKEYIEDIEECNRKFDVLTKNAIEYAQLRIQSNNLSDQEFVRINHQRTEAHDRFIFTLSDYIDEYIPFAMPFEEDEIRGLMENRRKVGDLACYFLFMEGIKASLKEQ